VKFYNLAVQEMNSADTKEGAVRRSGYAYHSILGYFREDFISPHVTEEELGLLNVRYIGRLVTYQIDEDVVFLV